MSVNTSLDGLVAADAVLMVIDVQDGFGDLEFWGRRNNPDCESNIATLLDAWRVTDRPVVAVRHDSVLPHSPLRPGSTGNSLQPMVQDASPDLLVTKKVNSAFYGSPDLHSWLQQHRYTQLVVCGMQTNLCCETTARMAGNLGYDVLFAWDATHTFDLEGPGGISVSADDLLLSTVTNLYGDQFARVVSTMDLVRSALPSQFRSKPQHHCSLLASHTAPFSLFKEFTCSPWATVSPTTLFPLAWETIPRTRSPW
ncbi:cysteine hydrolase family protein [Streptomyces sp. 1222.5]|uniref:cysteine hydrolase family protein n=1 Tax=Streptomyces sp. 1222.5 TaxID=1881026 RepID=UPI003D740B09